MERMVKIAKGTGRIILTILTGMLMPVLIWVALGVAFNQVTKEKRLGRAVPKDVPEKSKQQPVPDIYRLLTKTGLNIHDATVTKPCWEVLDCPPETQESCPEDARRDIPLWNMIK